METGDLTNLKGKDIHNIRNVAPKHVKIVVEDFNDIDLLYCRTVQDVYDVYNELEGKNKEVWERNVVYAERLLFREVKILSKYLMSKLLHTDNKDEVKELREQIKEVLVYESELSARVDENTRKELWKSEKGVNGYLMFRGWTDDEIYLFWNGENQE